jgi:hypothetical protein
MKDHLLPVSPGAFGSPSSSIFSYNNHCTAAPCLSTLSSVASSSSAVDLAVGHWRTHGSPTSWYQGLCNARDMHARHKGEQNTNAGNHKRINVTMPTSTVPVEDIFESPNGPGARLQALAYCVPLSRPIITARCPRIKATRALFRFFSLGSTKYEYY